MSIGSDPNLLNKHFLMIDDIDLDPNISTKYIFERPIVGAMMSPFLGVFDGAGFRIRHLTIVGSNQEEYEHLGEWHCRESGWRGPSYGAPRGRCSSQSCVRALLRVARSVS